MQIVSNTCRSCHYFNSKPRLVKGEEMPVGCCKHIEVATALEPETNRVTTSRPVIATDLACSEHLIEGEFFSNKQVNQMIKANPV